MYWTQKDEGFYTCYTLGGYYNILRTGPVWDFVLENKTVIKFDLPTLDKAKEYAESYIRMMKHAVD